MRRRHTHWALMTGVQTYALPISLTMVLGALGALAQNDLRRMAGFAVIAGIGNVMAGVAIGGSTGTSGAILYLLQSMVTRTAPYLLIGAARSEPGSVGEEWVSTWRSRWAQFILKKPNRAKI